MLQEAVDEEEEEKTPEQETPPIAPVTPERRQKQPAPKPASKPAPKRRRWATISFDITIMLSRVSTLPVRRYGLQSSTHVFKEAQLLLGMQCH